MERAFFIDGTQEKINALNIILKHYSDVSFVFPENQIGNVTLKKSREKNQDNYENPFT